MKTEMSNLDALPDRLEIAFARLDQRMQDGFSRLERMWAVDSARLERLERKLDQFIDLHATGRRSPSRPKKR